MQAESYIHYNKVSLKLKLQLQLIRINSCRSRTSHSLYRVMIYLFKDEGIEDDHAEVVDNEDFAELEGLSVLHVFGPQPEE